MSTALALTSSMSEVPPCCERLRRAAHCRAEQCDGRELPAQLCAGFGRAIAFLPVAAAASLAGTDPQVPLGAARALALCLNHQRQARGCAQAGRGGGRRTGAITADEASQMTDVPNMRQNGVRLGNWLTREQARELLRVPDRSMLKGKRDYAVLALLTGCALRRRELATLEVRTIQQREGRWVLADLRGKDGRVRTVALPIWVNQGIDAWTAAADIKDGRLLRRVSKSGKPQGAGLSDWAVWSVVEQSAKGIGMDRFGAHDLRRTCAKLCRRAGGDLEQIKFLLGHSSIQTTERYLGSEQEIAVAVNDSLGL